VFKTSGINHPKRMPEPAEAMQMPLGRAVRIGVTWEAVCFHGQGDFVAGSLHPSCREGDLGRDAHGGVAGPYTAGFLSAPGNMSQAHR